MSDLFDATQDLTAFSSATVTEGRLLDVARFLAVPPWSRDDLATVSGAKTSHKSQLTGEQLDGVVFVLERSWDPARFPWLAERRRPTPAEREVALRWTASIGADERMRTKMRMSGSKRQQKAVEAVFEATGYTRRRRLKRISALHHLPVGEFSGETSVAGTKADIAARLTDERLLALECKVSNSSLNSVKRLIREAGGKSQRWRAALGEAVIPAVVLAGVYKLQNLVEAQERYGLTIFWEHDLETLRDVLVSGRAT